MIEPEFSQEVTTPHRLVRLERLVTLLVVVMALALGAALAASLADVRYMKGADEGYYARYVEWLHEHGWRRFPELVALWAADPQAWVYPPPTRVGFLAACSVARALLGSGLRAISWVSVTSYVALIVSSHALLRRHLRRRVALTAVALLAVSPLVLGMARRALTESLVLLLAALAALLLLTAVLEPKRRWPGYAFAVAFTLAITVKETTLLLVVPFGALVAIERFWRHRPLGLLRFALLLAVPALAAALVWVVAGGGLTPVVRVMRIVLASPKTNHYALAYCSGPWYRYLIDFLALSPGPTLLGLAGLAVVVVRLREGSYQSETVAFALLYVLILLVNAPFIKNVRYVILLELPGRVLAALFIWEWCKAYASRWATIAAVVIVLALCWWDYRTFGTLFVRDGLYDPVSQALLGWRGLIIR